MRELHVTVTVFKNLSAMRLFALAALCLAQLAAATPSYFQITQPVLNANWTSNGRERPSGPFVVPLDS